MGRLPAAALGARWERRFERLSLGQPAAALDIARIAVRRNPLSTEPLFDLAAIQSATGNVSGAARSYERAVELQPGNAETWRRLGTYRALELRQPRAALAPLRAAYYLDPQSREVRTAYLLLQRQLAAAPSP
jgi:cytochrome c-type biogenesis protein CcmH/NrfG